MGIQISLQFLAEIDSLRGRNIHFFTDCQAAILTAFHNQLQMTKIEITMDIKQLINEIMEKDNMIHVHWVPAHKDIMGNELADQRAKAAAHEMQIFERRVKQNTPHFLKWRGIKKQQLYEYIN